MFATSHCAGLCQVVSAYLTQMFCLHGPGNLSILQYLFLVLGVSYFYMTLIKIETNIYNLKVVQQKINLILTNPLNLSASSQHTRHKIYFATTPLEN
jgi:hypothetical protein